MQTLHIYREACPWEDHANIPPPSPLSWDKNGASWKSVQPGQFNGSIIDSPSIVLGRLSISNSISNASGTWSPFEHSYSTSSSSGCVDVASSRNDEDEYGLGLDSPLQLKNLTPNSSPLHLSVCFLSNNQRHFYILHIKKISFEP